MRESGCGIEWLPCSTCAGTGEITAERAEAYRQGRELRNRRIAADRSLREEAKRLGVSPVALSRMERGLNPESGKAVGG
jgi:hypothetical protein